jgi:hypothetical protein
MAVKPMDPEKKDKMMQAIVDRIVSPYPTDRPWRLVLGRKYRRAEATVAELVRTARKELAVGGTATLAGRSAVADSGRLDLAESLQQTAEELAKQVGDRVRSGTESTEGNIVQSLTALGIAIDKLTLLRKSEDTEVWQRVLRADGVAALDDMIVQVRRKIASLQGASIGHES